MERVRIYRQFYNAGLTSAHIAQLLPCFDSGRTDAQQRTMLHEQRAHLQQKLNDLAEVIARLET